MTLGFDLPDDGWLEAIPTYQQQALRALLEAGKTEEEAAEIWLGQIGPTTNYGFGAGGVFQKYFENVKAEFVAFVCGEPRYEAERTKATEIWNRQGKIGLVSVVSGFIGTHLGLAAVAIVPVVALLFSLTAKLGVNAFCTSCGRGQEGPAQV